MRNIKKDLRMHVIRKFKGNVYYFDENGIVQKVDIKTAENIFFKNIIFSQLKNVNTTDIAFYFDVNEYFNCNNQTLLRKILCTLKVGDTVETLDKYLSIMKLESRIKSDENIIERFVTKINRPDFRREPENLNKNTFDFIFIDVNIVTNWHEDRTTFIKKHFDEITKKVLANLESNKHFQQFGVPINFLKVSKITLTQSSILRFIFELKKI